MGNWHSLGWVILACCGGEPVLLPPTVGGPPSTDVSSELTEPPPKPVKVKPGATTAWSEGGPLSQIELVPSDQPLAVRLTLEYNNGTGAGLKPFVMVYSDACTGCVLLRKNFGEPLMVEAFRGVHLVLLDQAKWTGLLESVGMKSESYPRFHELTDNGQVTAKVITGEAWEEDLPVNMAPPLQAFFRQ